MKLKTNVPFSVSYTLWNTKTKRFVDSDGSESADVSHAVYYGSKAAVKKNILNELEFLGFKLSAMLPHNAKNRRRDCNEIFNNLRKNHYVIVKSVLTQTITLA